MADLDSMPNPITMIGPALILAGLAIYAISLERWESMLVVLVLLAVTSFIAGRMSRDYW